MKIMVIVKATKLSETGVMPTKEQIAEMDVFNQELIKSGVMIDGAGMEASSGGARIHFSGSDRTVERGPFANTEEIISGFWFLRMNSINEAIELAKKIPFTAGSVEVRRVWEPEDYASVT